MSYSSEDQKTGIDRFVITNTLLQCLWHELGIIKTELMQVKYHALPKRLMKPIACIEVFIPIVADKMEEWRIEFEQANFLVSGCDTCTSWYPDICHNLTTGLWKFLHNLFCTNPSDYSSVFMSRMLCLMLVPSLVWISLWYTLMDVSEEATQRLYITTWSKITFKRSVLRFDCH